MKDVVTEYPQSKSVIISLADIRAMEGPRYIGYETDGGLRSHLCCQKNHIGQTIWGFEYFKNPEWKGQRKSLIFETHQPLESIEKAVRAGKPVVVFDHFYEMCNWLSNSIPTRNGAEYVANVIVSNKINVHEVVNRVENIRDCNNHRNNRNDF